VEEIARLVGEELSIILPGFIHTITGGCVDMTDRLVINSLIADIDAENPKATTLM